MSHATTPQHPRRLISAIAVACLTLATGCTPEPIAQLPKLGATTNQTSVSGISSGAYMSGQFQMAHGKLVAGAAIIAGGPYGCARSLFADIIPGPGVAFLNLSKAINGCMLNALMPFGVPNTSQLADHARQLASQGLIDPLEVVTNDKVYLFAGTEDRTVVPPIVRTAAEFYEKIGVSGANTKLIDSMPAGHAFVTEDKGLSCDVTGKPFVVDCDYDQAGEVLSFIYGRLTPRSPQPSGTYIAFDQTPFLRDLVNHGLADQGVVYVPNSCSEGASCRVHIAFHGCAQNRATVGDAFITGTGYARWADTNGFIVLFPQVLASPVNPQGCWDWWGYTGNDYLTKNAPQIKAVHRMLEWLGAPRAGA